MKNFLLVLIAILFINSMSAQTAGDYRSIASGTWGTLTVWERFDGVTWQPATVAPAYTDGAINIRSPHVITIAIATTMDQATIEAGATLINSNSITVNDGAGTDLTVDGTLQLGAALPGAGSTSINGTLNWNAGTITSPVTIAATGTANISSATAKAINGTMINNGTINWTAGNIDFNTGVLTNNGTINNSFDGTFTNTSGVNSFTNSGTFTKTGGTVNTTIAIPMISTGSLTVNTGTLLKTTNSLSNSGPIVVAAGAEFRSTSPFTINAGTTLSGSGTVTFGGNPTTNNLAFNMPSTLTLAAIAGSAVSGTGSFVINGTMNWTGGNFGNTLNIVSGAVLNISTAGTKTLTATITNDGTINWNAGSVNFMNGRINNNTLIDIKGDNTMSNFGGVNSLVNIGTIIKSAGAATSSITLPFTNTGNITVNSGTLISGGILNLNTGTVLSGTGTFGIDGTVNVNIPMNIPASLTIRKSGGTSVGTEIFTINGLMNWIGGAIASPFVIVSGATLSMATGIRSLNNTLTNNGTINWTGGGIDFNNGTLINNGNMANSFDGAMSNVTGTNLFNNTGTFSKIAGVVTNTNIAIPVTNSGTMNVNAGTLNNSGNSFMNTGIINVAAARTFSNTGTMMIQPGTSITGGGIFAMAGVTQFTTNINFPAAMTVNVMPGATTFGAGISTIASTLNWSGGVIGSPFVLQAGSTTNASGAAKGLYASMSNSGSMLWTAGDIQFNDGTLTNSGNINQSFDGMMAVVGGTNQFQNDGTFAKSGAGGTSAINVPVVNTGTVNGAGTINFNSTFANTGTIAPGIPVGLLSVTSASSPLLTASSVLNFDILDGTGPGTGHDQLQFNDNLVLSGTLNVTDLAATPAGSYTIVNLTSGTISGTFATINKPAAYTILIGPTTIILNKSTLPLNWLSFTGKKNGNKIVLNWSTENEKNNAMFEVQRSNDGKLFEKIGTVNAATEQGVKEYVFDDLYFQHAANYYRIKQTDIDGKSQYSKTVLVKVENDITSIKVFPNPSRGITNIVIPQEFVSGDIYVRNFSGHTIKIFKNIADRNLSLHLPKGNYFVQFKQGTFTSTQKLIVE